MKIFISFASEQAELAEALSLRLRERNHDVFFSSYNLPAGATYDYRIQSAINKSNLFIFLVSPQSISAGRYTLSELEFARANWPHPKGHVLPVVVSPTSVPHIPPYLKAVTLLQPSGDIVAETSAAVERVAQQLRRRRSRINVAMGILATVILCVGALLSYTYFPIFPIGDADAKTLWRWGSANR